jgi:transcriptional regulator
VYTPKPFNITDIHCLHDFIEAYSFATLISQKGQDVDVTHLPVMLNRDQGEKGTLFWHVAKANPHATAFDELKSALLIFHGPHAYVSHTWYTTSPSVPTWNYAVVHVYGEPQKISQECLSEDLSKMMRHYEKTPIETHFIPEGYKNNQLTHIVGFRMKISRIDGKFKLGQNRSPEDQEGMLQGLRKTNTPEALSLAEFIQSIRD